jgi:hypothetical protein
MNPAAEREVRIRLPADIEPVGIGNIAGSRLAQLMIP